MLATIVLQAPAGAGTIQMVMIGGMILVFWLFMIRPQAKSKKSRKNLLKTLKKEAK